MKSIVFLLVLVIVASCVNYSLPPFAYYLGAILDAGHWILSEDSEGDTLRKFVFDPEYAGTGRWGTVGCLVTVLFGAITLWVAEKQLNKPETNRHFSDLRRLEGGYEDRQELLTACSGKILVDYLSQAEKGALKAGLTCLVASMLAGPVLWGGLLFGGDLVATRWYGPPTGAGPTQARWLILGVSCLPVLFAQALIIGRAALLTSPADWLVIDFEAGQISSVNLADRRQHQGRAVCRFADLRAVEFTRIFRSEQVSSSYVRLVPESGQPIVLGAGLGPQEAEGMEFARYLCERFSLPLVELREVDNSD